MLDVDKFKYKENKVVKHVAKQNRLKEKFLKGPIPLSQISLAAKLPGKSLHVAIIIWIFDSIHKGEQFKLQTSMLEALGVKRNSAYRAIKHLENSGAITVVRHRGRLPLIKLIMRGNG